MERNLEKMEKFAESRLSSSEETQVMGGLRVAPSKCACLAFGSTKQNPIVIDVDNREDCEKSGQGNFWFCV